MKKEVRVMWVVEIHGLTIEAQAIKRFSPEAITKRLKTAGFKFHSDVCPVKFAGKFGARKNEDGSVTFRQELSEL